MRKKYFILWIKTSGEARLIPQDKLIKINAHISEVNSAILNTCCGTPEIVLAKYQIVYAYNFEFDNDHQPPRIDEVLFIAFRAGLPLFIYYLQFMLRLIAQ